MARTTRVSVTPDTHGGDLVWFLYDRSPNAIRKLWLSLVRTAKNNTILIRTGGTSVDKPDLVHNVRRIWFLASERVGMLVPTTPLRVVAVTPEAVV
jgi:hypothetical protein